MGIFVRAGIVRFLITTSDSIHVGAELMHFNLISGALPTGSRRFDYHLVGARTAASNHQKPEKDEYANVHPQRMRREPQFVNTLTTQNYSFAACTV